MSASKQALIDKQIEMYPDSMILDKDFVLSWAGNDARRLRAVLFAVMNYPNGIWYWIPRVGTSPVTGYRTGLAPESYMSGFSDL